MESKSEVVVNDGADLERDAPVVRGSIEVVVEAPVVMAASAPMFGGVIVAAGGVTATGTIDPRKVTALIGDPKTAESLKNSGVIPSDMTLPMRGADGSEGTQVVLRPVRPSSPVHVLVVEDDIDSAEYYSDVLVSVGLVPTLTHNVGDALEAVRSRSFALALIDIRLPDGNGYELCRSILAETDSHSFSALLMSGDPGLRDTANIARVGAKGFIINPVEPSVLAQQALAAVDHHEATPPQVQLGTELRNTTVQMRFFGRGRVEVNGVSVPIPSGRSLEIIGSLAAASPSAMSSERLARFAWHERPAVSTNAVYTAVSRLRQYLSDHHVPDLLDNDGDGYYLRIDPGNIDLVEFASRGAEVLRLNSASSEQLGAVLSMWQPVSLDHSSNPLLTHWMQRLHEMWAQLSEALAGAYINELHHDSAAIVCRDLLESDPWRESVWATLMVALYRAGRPNDALSAFADARRRLRNELGLDPGPALRALEMMVLTHDQALTAAAPPGVSNAIIAVRSGAGPGR